VDSIPHVIRFLGRAVAQAVSCWLTTAAAQVRVRAACGVCGGQRGRFSPSTSVSPAHHHSTNFSIIIITLGWHNRPNSGRSAEWTQLDSNPHTNLKNTLSIFGSCLLRISAGTPAILTTIFRGIIHCSHKCWDSTSITSRPLPSKPFLIHPSSYYPTLYILIIDNNALSNIYLSILVAPTWSLQHP
jgi:hypothetical protein